MEVVNMNHGLLMVSDYPNGHTHRIPVRIGRKLFYMDISKNAISANIELYTYSPWSKYGAPFHHSITVKPAAILDRKALEKVAEIEAAQQIYRQFYDLF